MDGLFRESGVDVKIKKREKGKERMNEEKIKQIKIIQEEKNGEGKKRDMVERKLMSDD